MPEWMTRYDFIKSHTRLSQEAYTRYDIPCHARLCLLRANGMTYQDKVIPNDLLTQTAMVWHFSDKSEKAL